jgi:hypothetical protein
MAVLCEHTWTLLIHQDPQILDQDTKLHGNADLRKEAVPLKL